MAKRRRWGRPNPLTRHLLPVKRAPIPVSVKRASEKAIARMQHPELTAWLERCDGDFRAAKLGGRFDYERVLFKVFAKVQKWKRKGELNENVRTVAQIGGFHLRDDASPFLVVLKACGDRNPKTLSRWAELLDAASSHNVEGLGFQVFLNKRKANRRLSSAA